MSDEFINSAQMITNVFNGISASSMEQSDKVCKAWKTTVSKISGNGEKLAAHSFVVDLKNGILLVESDHPGWNQMLQMHKKFILTGLNRLSGGVKIESLAFRVKGSPARLASVEEITKKAVERYAQKIEDDQKRLEEMGYVNKDAAADVVGGPSQIPPEVKEIFDRMRKEAQNR